MKVGKAIKKIVALGIGATMMGATILGATAADFSDYPNFFLDGGQYDGVIVVRGDADSLAAVDITNNMFYAGTGASTTTTTSVQGDAWEVKTSSKKLELANSNVTQASISGEMPRDVNTFIGSDELNGLSDQTWKTNEKDFTFQQYLFFDNLDEASSIVKYSENDDSETDVFFFVKSARQIARYKAEFTSTAESDITDSVGSADTTGTFLDDFEDTELPMWGKPYNVVQARRNSNTGEGGANIKLVLMSGTAKDTLLEGESGTYTVEGEEYTVELNFVDADEAKFLVNGEQTNKLKDGDTYVLKGGKEVGVSEILYQDYAGGVHSATFYLGAEKIEMRDDDVDLGPHSHELVVGSETIDGAAVVISGSGGDNTTFKITTIEVNMTAEDDYFVGAGEKLSDIIAAAGDENQMLFNGAFDVEYKGLTQPKTHDIKLSSTSARRYKLKLYDGDGNPVDIPVAYAESATNLSFAEDGQNSKKLYAWGEDSTPHDTAGGSGSKYIQKDDYFVVTGGTAGDGSAKSYLLQYRGSDARTKTSPKIQFKNMGSGETLEYAVTTVPSGALDNTAVATLKLGGYSFAVFNRTAQNADDFRLMVDLDGGGAINPGISANGNTTIFVDSYGSQWSIGSNSTPCDVCIGDHSVIANGTPFIIINQTTPNGDDYDNKRPAGINLVITPTTGPEVRAALGGGADAQPALSLLTPDGETEVAYGWTSMGVFVKQSSPSSDPQEYILTYPEEQRLPQVFVTAGAVTSKTVATGSGLDRVTIPLTATKLPEEVTNVKSQHIITIGGPCANSVTAAVMYTEQGKTVPANCAEDFSEGAALVALYDVGDKVAMVVAGFSGDDTRRAGKVLASRAAELSGTQVTIEGTTASNAEIVKVK